MEQGIYLPGQPPIDKVAAAAAIRQQLGWSIPIVGFWRTNQNPSEEILLDWAQRGIIPIDIGDEKYHKVGRKSALQRTVELRCIGVNPAMATLIDMIDVNNNGRDGKRGGFLKQGPHAIPWIIREGYKLRKTSDFGVANRGAHVVETWFATFDKRSTGLYADTQEVAEIYERVRVNRRTFSVAEYIENMIHLGISSDEITKSATWWIETEEAAHVAQRAAEEAWRDGTLNYEVVTRTRGGDVLWVETDNPYVLRAGIKVMTRASMVIARGTGGNIHVLSRIDRVNLDRLAGMVKDREPEVWFHDKRLGGGALLNGTESLSEIPPTKISRSEMVDLIRKYVV